MPFLQLSSQKRPVFSFEPPNSSGWNEKQLKIEAFKLVEIDPFKP